MKTGICIRKTGALCFTRTASERFMAALPPLHFAQQEKQTRTRNSIVIHPPLCYNEEKEAWASCIFFDLMYTQAKRTI